MSYLLHCIVDRDAEEPRDEQCLPLLSHASILVRTAGLGAVVSRVPAPLAYDVARLLAYARTIECHNRKRTVIPMRYGCSFSDLAEIRGLLERRQEEYRRLLSELEGSVEMSARVAYGELPSSLLREIGAASRPPSEFAHSTTNGPGTAYLAKRSIHYSFGDACALRCDQIRKSIHNAAEGTYLRCTSELSVHTGKPALAMYFLVPREGVRRFVSALQPVSARAGAALEVTGPWPPYNFV